ncbi:MAG TPA: lipid-A-disaccharide synthase [Puia sp.]|nr:lipid-A-disaccharide synthase [Puia sp.]
MRYYIIAGEASGDLHGSNLIKELHRQDAGAVIRCWGGELMQAAGAELVKHYRELAFMGFVEVVKNLPAILQNIKFCKQDVKKFHPDAIIFIDYPGFNLRMAKWAKQENFKTIYYISPQVWAWKENRVKMIRKCIDKMLVILPFEKEFYQKWNYDVEYVGHPLVNVIDRFRDEDMKLQQKLNLKPRSLNPKPFIALLPGSRKQEILKKLPVMLEASKSFPQYSFVVAQAPGQEESFYAGLLKNYSDVFTVSNQTYLLLSKAKAACVTSGTATLETALFAVPEVVCYKGNAVSYQIAKRLIKVKFISLVNLIMDKLVVKELIQDEFNVENLKKELNNILTGQLTRQKLQKDYTDLKDILLAGGDASANAAKSIVGFLKEKD